MKLDHIVLLASDLDRSAQFYDLVLTQLGFQKVKNWAWVCDDGLNIDLQQAKEATPYGRYAPGLNHFAFTVESEAEFTQILQGLEQAGIKLPNVQKFDGGLAVFLPDPDGLRLEIAWEP